MTRANGFTLIEVAIVTVVLTLLLGGLLIPLTAQVDQRRYAETRKLMEEIQEALIGFAQINGRLPCPAGAGGDGKELAPAGDCDGVFEGDLPWVTLSVPMQDSWGHRFRYRVYRPLTVASNAFPPLPANQTLRVLRDSQGAESVLADGVVAIIVSHGNNGLGAISMPQPANGSDERKNADGVATAESETDRTFVYRVRTDGAAGCSDTTADSPFCEFDDAVVWISPFILFNRMAQAGHFIAN